MDEVRELLARVRASMPARSDDARVVGGVAGALGEVVGLDPVIVRLVFVVLAFTFVGFPLYLVLWFLMPTAGSAPEVVPSLDEARLRGLIGAGLVGLGSIVIVRRLGVALLPDAIVWPVVIITVGLALLAWQLGTGRDDKVRDVLLEQRWTVARVVVGVLVIGIGLASFFAANMSLSGLGGGLIAFALVAAGLGLMFGPWIWLLARDLQAERRRRMRADERAEVAAHLHDSVLQTLSLIQRTDDATEAARLARRQERELRSWLYGRHARPETDLQVAVEQATAEVEDRYGVPIEVVVVGEAALDEGGRALVAAMAEALTNAAKFSAADRISVFVEVDDEAVEAFVRDKGMGFDRADVAEDRLGLVESIEGRMQRAGGQAEITSEPGRGTEVLLRIDRVIETVR